MMGIEKDIQQTKFRNPHQKAAINLIYTLSWMREKTKAIFEAEDITPQQFNILRILERQFSATPFHFADKGKDAGKNE